MAKIFNIYLYLYTQRTSSFQQVIQIAQREHFVGNHVTQRIEKHPNRPYKGYAWITTLEGDSDPNHIQKQFLQLANQDYLGVSMEPQLLEGMIDCLRKYGYGRSANGFAGGHCDLHIQLERKISKYYGTEATVLHDSCGRSNITTIPALTDENSYILSDEYSHRTLIEGCKLSKVPKQNLLIFKHNDMEHLEKLLSSIPLEANKLIIGDGLCSIMGGLMDLGHIIPLSRQYHATVLVDEAHAIGVVGPHGKGTHDYYGIDLSKEKIIITGSLAKTLQSAGGYVTGPQDLVNRVKLSSGTFFSGNPLPLDCFVALKTMDLLTDDRRERMNQNVEQWIQLIQSLGFKINHQVGPIVTIVLNDPIQTVKIMKSLYQYGILAMGAIPPITPPGKSVIRTMITAGLTTDDLQFAYECFKRSQQS